MRLRAAAVAACAFAACAVNPGSGSARVEPGTKAAHGVEVLRYKLRSRHAGRTLRQVAAIPPGEAGAPRPLLVFLHGRGRHGEESNANGAFFAALARLGARAPVVVFPSGGQASYFHDRDSGDWGRYVLDEVIPEAVRRLGVDPQRVAIGGISMGGFGAFDLGRRREFCAVGGHSAALWLRAADTAPGAFDDAEDFARHDLVALARKRGRKPWGDAALWLDGGAGDPFRMAGDTLAGALSMRMRHWRGGHTGDYWHAHYDDYLRFYARALARC